MLMMEGGGRDHFRSLLSTVGVEAVAFNGVAALLRGWRRDMGRLLFLDVDLPEDDWSGLISQLHDVSGRTTAVVGIGATAPSAAVALDAGADEFVALPCGAPELAARVQAALRRAGTPRADVAVPRCGPCTLDVAGQRLVAPRGSVELTSRETALARCLFQSAGALVTRRRLAHIWEAEEDIAGRSIEQHVYQLRRKLKRCAGDTVVLRSVYARGYQLEAVPAPSGAAAATSTAN